MLIKHIGHPLILEFIDNNGLFSDKINIFMKINCQNATIEIIEKNMLKRFLRKRKLNLDARTFSSLFSLEDVNEIHQNFVMRLKNVGYKF